MAGLWPNSDVMHSCDNVFAMNYDILFLLITIQFFMYVYIFFFLSSKID